MAATIPEYDAEDLATRPALVVIDGIPDEPVRTVTDQQLATAYGAALTTIRRHLAREGAPCPAQTLPGSSKRPLMLWEWEAVTTYLDSCSAQLRNKSPRGMAVDLIAEEAAARRRSRRPARIGTKTPTAGRPYVWRDPRRWNTSR